MKKICISAKIKKRAWKEITDGHTAVPLPIWYLHFAALGMGNAGHLPGSINQDTICVDKAGSDSKTPWHIEKKNQQLILLEIEMVD